MKEWKNWIRIFFRFSKKERTGLLVLMILLFLAWLFPEIFSQARRENEWKEIEAQLNFPNKLPEPGKDSRKKVDSSGILKLNKFSPKKETDYSRIRFFYFDPNTLSDSGWYRLGISSRHLQTIRNYLSKGGHFYHPDDLMKIYGLRREWTERAVPFVRIEETEHKRSSAKKERGAFHPANWEKPFAAPLRLEINLADSADWEKLPGIGPKLAQRIIRFRSGLGGFFSVQQVAEVYGLKDSVFKKIEPSLYVGQDLKLNQIDINEATIPQLASHPYIDYSMARNIVRFREEHGPFRQLEELSEAGGISDQKLRRIKPYVKIH